MRHIKTFEQYSLPVNEEEGFFKRFMQGSESCKITGLDAKDTQKLLDKHKDEFTVEDGKLLASKPANSWRDMFEKTFGMTKEEAFEAALKMFDKHGTFMARIDDKESKWDKDKKEFLWVNGGSKTNTSFAGGIF